MSVQFVYKNKGKSSNSGVIALFTEEKFQLKNVSTSTWIILEVLKNYLHIHI